MVQGKVQTVEIERPGAIDLKRFAGFTPRITVFHCVKSLDEDVLSPFTGRNDLEINTIKLPCSGVIKDVHLLKAFVAGADAVVVFACPEENCRYIEGSKRARKRVDHVKTMLDEIGLDGNRLSIYNITREDEDTVYKIISETLAGIDKPMDGESYDSC